MISAIATSIMTYHLTSHLFIDGDSIHDCVTALKPRILEIIEKARDEELVQRKAKKKQQEEEDEAKRKASELVKKATASAEEASTSEAASETGTTMTITPAPTSVLQVIFFSKIFFFTQ